jgi:phospholipid/cholesterol/gamma-HCH transport system substrate-binding protein
MQYSKELKVGAVLLLSALVFFAGLRFFQDLPLFESSYVLKATFEEASGLSEGNPVEMKGVGVGIVESVRLDQNDQVVRVEMRIDQGIRVPEGSHVRVTGFSGVTGVRIVIQPGPPDNPALASGATLSPPPQGTVLERLSDQAPALAAKADSVLGSTNTTMRALSDQINNPDSDFRATLQALRQTMEDVESITEAEKESVRQLLRNLEAISGDLREFTGSRGDSLSLAVDRLNRSLTRLDRSLASFEQSTATLDEITTKIDDGKGTMGRLINDPSLYNRVDSAAAHTNRLLLDFQENPGRYLEDMTLVKVF